MTPTDRALLTSDVAELGLPKDALDLLAAIRASGHGVRFLIAQDIVAAGPLITAGLAIAKDDAGFCVDGIALWLTERGRATAP